MAVWRIIYRSGATCMSVHNLHQVFPELNLFSTISISGNGELVLFEMNVLKKYTLYLPSKEDIICKIACRIQIRRQKVRISPPSWRNCWKMAFRDSTSSSEIDLDDLSWSRGLVFQIPREKLPQKTFFGEFLSSHSKVTLQNYKK